MNGSEIEKALLKFENELIDGGHVKPLFKIMPNLKRKYTIENTADRIAIYIEQIACRSSGISG